MLTRGQSSHNKALLLLQAGMCAFGNLRISEDAAIRVWVANPGFSDKVFVRGKKNESFLSIESVYTCKPTQSCPVSPQPIEPGLEVPTCQGHRQSGKGHQGQAAVCGAHCLVPRFLLPGPLVSSPGKEMSLPPKSVQRASVDLLEVSFSL